jgi:hypothetical protein
LLLDGSDESVAAGLVFEVGDDVAALAGAEGVEAVGCFWWRRGDMSVLVELAVNSSHASYC